MRDDAVGIVCSSVGIEGNTCSHKEKTTFGFHPKALFDKECVRDFVGFKQVMSQSMFRTSFACNDPGTELRHYSGLLLILRHRYHNSERHPNATV